MGYIFLKLTVYVSEPVCDHSGLCYPLHEYSTTIYGLPYWPISHYSESTTNIIVGLCPHFIHWHLWIFLHSQCFDHKQMFLREPYLESLLLAWPPPSNRLKGTMSSWQECLCSVNSVFGNLSGQYPDTEGLGLINQHILISPRMQYQGIPESWWNANEIYPVHLLVAVSSQVLEPVQPVISRWFAGVAELQV